MAGQSADIQSRRQVWTAFDEFAELGVPEDINARVIGGRRRVRAMGAGHSEESRQSTDLSPFFSIQCIPARWRVEEFATCATVRHVECVHEDARQCFSSGQINPERTLNSREAVGVIRAGRGV